MTAEMDDITSLLPLREPTFYILLSLAQREKHGYAIIKDVVLLSGDGIRLSTGTLYEALARLLDQTLIERVPDAGAANEGLHPGRPRKAYRLTQRGQRVLQAEVARLQQQVAAANRRLHTAAAG